MASPAAVSHPRGPAMRSAKLAGSLAGCPGSDPFAEVVVLLARTTGRHRNPST